MLIAEIMYVCETYNVLLKSMLIAVICIMKINYMSLNFNYNYVTCLQTQLKFWHSQIVPAFDHFYICQFFNKFTES